MIGLARTTDGNEHLINPAATELIFDCLKADEGSEEAELISRIDAVKRKMVPDCYLCASPCGKNDPFDMDCLQNEEPHMRALKLSLLESLFQFAKRKKTASKDEELLLYKALILIGIEGPSEHMLTSLHFSYAICYSKQGGIWTITEATDAAVIREIVRITPLPFILAEVFVTYRSKAGFMK